MSTFTETAPASLGSHAAELARTQSEREIAESRNAAHNGLMHIVALLKIDWQSQYLNRSESLDNSLETVPAILEAREALGNAERRARAARTRIEGAEAERAAAVDRHAQAVRNGSDEDAQAARSAVIALDANAALLRDEVEILAGLANEARTKCDAAWKRERSAHQNRISEQLKGEHSEKFDSVLEMLDTAEFRAALGDLAALAELRSDLQQGSRIANELRNILPR